MLDQVFKRRIARWQIGVVGIRYTQARSLSEDGNMRCPPPSDPPQHFRDRRAGVNSMHLVAKGVLCAGRDLKILSR